MSARVLVASPLATFLERTEVPQDIVPELLEDGEPVPHGDYVGIIPLLTRRMGAAEFDRLPNLRVVANYAVGYDNIDVREAASRGIRVSNTPGVLTVATAELTWALILAAARRVGEGERMVRAGEWTGWAPTQLLGMGLDGKTLGIVGAGRIGREVARRAPAFRMRVVYWSRTRQPEWEHEEGVEWRELDQLLAEADVVSLHVPHTPDTDRLIDGRALALMKPTAVLVNTARGSVVDEPALIEALSEGRIRAAGLDVYAKEPTVPERLRELHNVVLLPHLGSATEETRMAMWQLAFGNLVRGVRGEPLITPVRP
ncbi:MAG TPA: D-glycerate dehydrogenase [Longimicrobiales bacterium]|nr:D-glycerate dehydrogenase [Longimicrobiales bacterium]